MVNLKFIKQQLKAGAQEINNLKELRKFTEDVMELLENRINEVRTKEIEKYSTGQVIYVDIEGDVLEFKVVKTTPRNRIHGKGLEGKYFNEVFSFPPDAVVEIKNGQ